MISHVELEVPTARCYFPEDATRNPATIHFVPFCVADFIGHAERSLTSLFEYLFHENPVRLKFQRDLAAGIGGNLLKAKRAV